MWTAFWGFITLAMSCFYGMVSLPPEYAYLRPWSLGGAILFFVISMLIFCWPLRQRAVRANVVAYCRHPMILASKLEPIHVIILGLAIACGGVAWQYYQGPQAKQAIHCLAAS
jgi:hypothetical protein